MNKKKKNQIEYFYQILSDIKNNIDTLIKELYQNQNNLENFAISKPVILKSKYPDLKKLNILKKTDKWEITSIGKELIEIYKEKDKDAYQKMIASIIGTYNYNGFRPYAVLCKFLYIKFGINNYLKRDEIIKFISLPINEAMYFINNEKGTRFGRIIKEKMIEAPRPYSYWVNYLKNAGLVIKDKKGIKLTKDVEEFLKIFFSEIDSIPKSKKEISRYKYRIISRGANQITFRNLLLEAYEGRCALSGTFLRVGTNNLLEATHIIPVSHGGSYEINNGILMTPSLHKAFDVGAITFDEKYNMIVHPDVQEKNYLPTIKKINYLPKNKDDYPSLASIHYHRKYIYNIGVTNSKKII